MTDDTRSRIVHAAMELFWEKGYSSTSVADVLKRSNANSGSLYHFFPGKQDLLLAVLEAYRTGIHTMLLAPAWGHVSDPIERIFALLARYRALIVQTECFYGCPIGSLALEIHEPDPPVRELLAANFSAWTDAVQACLEAARDRLPEDTDTRELAEFVLTTMEGAVMQSRTYRDVSHFDRSVHQLRVYFDLLQRTRAGSAGGTRRAPAGEAGKREESKAARIPAAARTSRKPDAARGRKSRVARSAPVSRRK